MLYDPHQQPEVLQVGTHGGRHSRVLHLDRDLAAIAQARPKDLADRRSGGGVRVEIGEQIGDPIASAACLSSSGRATLAIRVA